MFRTAEYRVGQNAAGDGWQPNATYFVPKRSVGQSFGFASELPLGPSWHFWR